MREFRQNAHVRSLGVWAIFCAAAAILLFMRPPGIFENLGSGLAPACGLALLLFGPVAVLVYLLRSALVRISVDPARGLWIRGRKLVPWETIDCVERRRPLWRPEVHRPIALRIRWARFFKECWDGGRFLGLILFLAAAVLVAAFLLMAALVVAVFIPLILVPMVEFLTPLGERIRIMTPDRTFLLRDISDADEFIDQLRGHVLILER